MRMVQARLPTTALLWQSQQEISHRIARPDRIIILEVELPAHRQALGAVGPHLPDIETHFDGVLRRLMVRLLAS